VIARCRVISSHAETPSVHHLRIEKPRGFEFLPVQFCGLEIPTADGSEEYPMSLASSPTRPYLEFGARVTGSPWKSAFRALAPGDAVEIDGPYGHFVLDEHRDAVLVAGGIGITPLKGMAEYAADKRLPIQIALVYSNRDENEIAYRTALDELARANPRFRVFHTITRPKPGSAWTGRTGRVDSELLRAAAAGMTDPIYYICGKPAMVEGTFGLLAASGVPRARIRFEEFVGYV
jgi:ferredoxin-NADP reductase